MYTLDVIFIYEVKKKMLHRAIFITTLNVLNQQTL